jgi:hypothetical protein
MNMPQYIKNATFVGAPADTKPSDLNANSGGVTFTSTNASVTIPFADGITPIVVSVSVLGNTTNVNSIRVIITTPDGTVLVNETSPTGTNTVTPSYLQALPENSTVTIIFQTSDGQPPRDVTVSIYACYTPSTATTIVTTGTVTPTISTSTPTISISTTNTAASTQSTGE